ncbi:MAG: Gfo/Idh/MocA family oxidoreductase [Rhodospirillales bacterium]|nr:Gfo/Idh/MocA family oxidoreductase [Rhodospirillales bacterium]
MIRLGLIGAGRWGRVYIESIKRLPELRLARVASRNPETAARVGPDTTVEPDWRAVAQAPDLKGVIIATPPATHAEIALAAIEVGMPVLVEKPLALDVESAATIRQAAVAHKSFVMVEHTHLFHPAFRALKELGAPLGRLRRIDSEAGNHGPFRPDTPVLWDWGAHDVAMALDLVGRMPVELSAKRTQSESRAEGQGENLEIELVFPEGIEARICLGNLFATKRRTLAAQFERATLVYDDLAPAKLTLHPPGSDGRQEPGEPLAIADTRPLDVALREFAEAILAERDDTHSLDLGVAVVSVLAALEEKLS